MRLDFFYFVMYVGNNFFYDCFFFSGVDYKSKTLKAVWSYQRPTNQTCLLRFLMFYTDASQPSLEFTCWVSAALIHIVSFRV